MKVRQLLCCLLAASLVLNSVPRSAFAAPGPSSQGTGPSSVPEPTLPLAPAGGQASSPGGREFALALQNHLSLLSGTNPSEAAVPSPQTQAAAQAIVAALMNPTRLPGLVSGLSAVKSPDDPDLGKRTGEALTRLIERAREDPAAAKSLLQTASALAGGAAPQESTLALAFENAPAGGGVPAVLPPRADAPGKSLPLNPAAAEQARPPSAPVPAPARNIDVQFLPKRKSWRNPIDYVWRIFSFGQVFAARGLIRKALNDLYIPGDSREYTAEIWPSPEPNAMIEPGNAHLVVFLGLLPFSANYDEFASAIAHEMTHDNPGHLKRVTTDVPWVQNLLDDVTSGLPKEERGRQVEEIRADLGAVDRLIRAGRNPAALYNFLSRMNRLFADSWDAKLMRLVYRVFFRSSFAYWEEHPADEIRLQAIKTYIQWRGFDENIARIQGRLKPFPVSARLLRWRLMAPTVLFSPWLWRALAGYWIYDIGLWILSLLSPTASNTVSGFVARVLGAAWDALYKYVLSYAWEYALRPFFSWLGEHALVPAWNHGAVPAWDWLGGLMDAAAALLQELPLSLRVFALSAPVVFIALRSLYKWYMGGDDTYTAHAFWLLRQSVGDEERKAAALNAANDPDGAGLAELLALTQERLEQAHMLEKSFFLRSTRWLNGLGRRKRLWEDFYRSLLERMAARMDAADPAQRAAFYNYIRDIPRYLLEEDRTTRLLEAIIGLSGRVGSFSGPEKSSYQESWNAYFLRLRREALALGPEAHPELVLRYAAELLRFQLNDTARLVFDRHYERTLDFVLSRRDSAYGGAADEWEKVERSLRLVLPRGRGLRLTRARLSRRSRPLGERMALLNLVRSVDYAGDWLGSFERRRIFRDLNGSFTSISDLRDFVDTELRSRGTQPDSFSDEFYRLLLAHPEWIRGKEDLEALLAEPSFWPIHGTQKSGELEKMLVKAVEKMAQKYPERWRSEPAQAERLHALYLDGLSRLSGLPTDLQGRMVLWEKLTQRGVTSRTDRMFAELYEKAKDSDPAIQRGLEKQALAGRIWEQPLKARIVLRQVRASNAFQRILRRRDPGVRRAYLEGILDDVAKSYPEKGVHYMGILETVSREINSSKEESALIEKAKRPAAAGEEGEDFGLRVLSALTDATLGWSRSEQWNLILFLRGDAPPTRKIQRAFRVTGTERIRRMFEVMPVAARMKLLDTFLISHRGLLGTVSTRRGYGRKILEQVLPKKNPAARQTAIEILDAFLWAVQEATQSAGQQSDILAYMLSVPKDEAASLGKTIKGILEGFGATGVKIGQLLAASELFDEEDTKELRALQERARVPDRADMYADLARLSGDPDPPFLLRELLGAASIKYAARAREKATGLNKVLKFFRKSAQAHTEFEFILLEKMSERLYGRHGAKYGVFRSMTKVSRKAVERELDPEHEIRRAKIARERMYANLSGEGWTVSVPQEEVRYPGLIVSEYAKGVSFWDLPPDLRSLAAKAILHIENGLFFADKDVISFDPDRHPGNYRIDVLKKDGRVTLHIQPIDHGQGLEITRKQRDQVFELFALTQILKETGAAAWPSARLASILELSPAQARRARRALARYFPKPDLRRPAAYYSLLAALDEAGLDMDIAYFDFIRGLAQFGQYAEQIQGDPGEPTPRQRLESLVGQSAGEMKRELRLGPWELAKLGLWRASRALRVEEAWRKLGLFLAHPLLKAALALGLLGAGSYQVYNADFFTETRQAIERSLPWVPGRPVSYYESEFERRLEAGEKMDDFFLRELSLMSGKDRPSATQALINLGKRRGGEEKATSARTLAQASEKGALPDAAWALQLLRTYAEPEAELPSGFDHDLLRMVKYSKYTSVRREAGAALVELALRGRRSPLSLQRDLEDVVEGKSIPKEELSTLIETLQAARESYDRESRQRSAEVRAILADSSQPAERREAAAEALNAMYPRMQADPEDFVGAYAWIFRNPRDPLRLNFMNKFDGRRFFIPWHQERELAQALSETLLRDEDWNVRKASARVLVNIAKNSSSSREEVLRALNEAKTAEKARPGLDEAERARRMEFMDKALMGLR